MGYSCNIDSLVKKQLKLVNAFSEQLEGQQKLPHREPEEMILEQPVKISPMDVTMEANEYGCPTGEEGWEVVKGVRKGTEFRVPLYDQVPVESVR